MEVSYVVVLVCLCAVLGAGAGVAGCTELGGVTEGEAVHVTAMLEVTVIDSAGKPVAGVPVSFHSVKTTGTSVKEGSEFSFSRSTESNGKTTFTVGYNLHPPGIGYPPAPDVVMMSVTIPPEISEGAMITYDEAKSRAGGTGTAAITKQVTLQIPYAVK
ncbi:Ig-like domain-containing protein [Methanoculleus oceani]|uniref:Carboxypeptidase regulatory-like domain-containing protein n=1 Tax=Methanoculleus oceani TaxID=2184756 RepID=A0ABD4TAS3_9EURY|nr:Ig-like domain-containing protein [Methanoculleus sp. CWC-02]MCM2465656.1 hypothetical protein [Methanoculleus sp. CWC-02]